MTILGIAIVLYLLIAPALGIAGFAGASRRREEIDALRRQIAVLGQQIEALRETLGMGERPAETAPPEPEAAPEPEAPIQPEPEEPAAPKAAESAPPRQETGRPAAPARPTPPPRPRPAAAAAGPSFEQQLASRWLLWLGGLTLALAGAFLVKYSYDRGWLYLSPAARVSLGFVLGVALAAGGEWLRRRPLQRAIALLGPNYLPPALTAAGLFCAFASVYSAYGLYALVPPLVAFALLAAVAFAAVGLAILQGPMIAILGLLGGFATPLLVSTGNNSAWALFGYLLFLIGGSLAVVRYMSWWWLAWAALAGAVIWPLLWFGTVWSPGDAVPLGVYLVALSALFLGIRYGRGASVEVVTWNKGLATLARPEQVAWGAASAVVLLAFILARMDAYGTAALVTLFVLGCLFLVWGYREAVFDALAIVAAVLVVALMATWHLPHIITRPESQHEYEGLQYGGFLGPVVPPELLPFVIVLLAFGALFALGGFLALAGARRPGIWAGVSAVAPAALLAIAYWRIVDFGLDWTWSGVAVVLAAVNLAAASQIRRRPPPRHADLALGAYAAATVAALSLGFAMAFEQAVLTVALSIQLPALAWIHDRLDLKPLRTVALVMAAVVLLRLVANYNVLDYPRGGLPWVLYGYGLPALAFWWAAGRFRRSADDRLVMVLEAGTLVFVWLLVTFEIRNLVAGSLTASRYGLLEQALQSIAWLALAYGCLRLYRRYQRKPLLWGWRLLAGLAGVHTLLFQMLGSNPLWSSDPVGAWPLFNVLLLAYLVPAAFAFLFAREFRQTEHKDLTLGTAVYGLALVFLYLSLEVRRAFHGPVLSIGATGDPEFYTYSVVWLGYALALLALGIWRHMPSLRYASLAILLVTVAKVFLFDMAALDGLLKVASFLGLGLSLVAIGYFYQRFVFPPRAAPAAQAGGAAPAGAG